jgi:YVTN family beta-propeller protein
VAENANTTGVAEVLPITVATDTVGTAITGLGPHPFFIAITPDGTKAYVTDAGSGSNGKVYPVALPAGTVGTPISTGASTPGIAITPDATKAYAASGANVVPINVSTDTAGTPIPVSGGAFSVAITPDSKTVYVTNDTGATVTPIDVGTNTPGAAISSVGSTPRGIAITPDQAPVANFSVASAPPGSATTFDASASTVRFGTIARYDWSFGDGSTLANGGPTPSHVYATTRSYTATVTETDGAGTSVSGEVYTGQSASSVGNPSAQTGRSVVITNAAAPAVVLSAPSLGFGTVAVGRPSAPQVLRITNTGSAPLVLSGSAISGVQAGDFKLSADACSSTTIAAGASCTASLIFTPSAGGTRSAQVAFTDNASGSPHVVSLLGTGTSLGSVTGHVLQTTTNPARPVAGAFVSICPRGQNGIELGGANCRSTTTDSTGEYDLPNLTPGSSAMEVNPASSGLESGSAILTVAVGPPTIQDFSLLEPRPFPQSITITSSNGSQAGGSTVLFWDAPFQITFPILAAPAHAQPDSLGITSIHVLLSSGGQPVLGSSLIYLTAYDTSGNAVGGRAIARPVPGAVAGGFDFTFGGLAITSGSRGAGSSTLDGATRIVAQSSGLHRQAHGNLTLRIGGVRVATKAAQARGRRATGIPTDPDATGPGTPDCESAAQELQNYLDKYETYYQRRIRLSSV